MRERCVEASLIENKSTGVHAFVVKIQDQVAIEAAKNESLMSMIIEDVSQCVRVNINGLFGESDGQEKE